MFIRWYISDYRECCPGGHLNIKMTSHQYRDPMLKIRRSRDRLIFNMGIPIPRKDELYIEMWPRLLLGLLSRYPIFMSSHWNSLEYRIPINLICEIPISVLVAEAWLHEWEGARSETAAIAARWHAPSHTDIVSSFADGWLHPMGNIPIDICSSDYISMYMWLSRVQPAIFYQIR